MFDSYKCITLLKMMKAIIKSPNIIKENREITQKNRFSLLSRLGKLRDKQLKISIFLLFIRHFKIKKHIYYQLEAGKRKQIVKGVTSCTNSLALCAKRDSKTPIIKGSLIGDNASSKAETPN